MTKLTTPHGLKELKTCQRGKTSFSAEGSHVSLLDVADVDSVGRKLEGVNVVAEEPREVAVIAPTLAEVFQVDGDDLLRRLVVDEADEGDAVGDENRTDAPRRRASFDRPVLSTRHHARPLAIDLNIQQR